MRKVLRTVAKPFGKIMGFIGRLGWVGTLAMMIAMPYIAGFWGSMTEGVSTWIGGTAGKEIGKEAVKQVAAEATKTALKEGAKTEVAKQVGAEAGKAIAKKAATTVGEKIGSRFVSGIGEATGLFAKGPMAKALGYTLKSMQIGISGIGKVYSSLTDLVTAGVDFIAQPLMKEGMSFTDSMTNWVGDRFNEARKAMGLTDPTGKGWSPEIKKTAAVANANEVDFTKDATNVVTTTTPVISKVSQETVDSFKKRLDALKPSGITTASDLVEAQKEIAGIGTLQDGKDLLEVQGSILTPDATVARQMRIRGTDVDFDARYDQGPMTKITEALDMPSILEQQDDLGFFQKGWQNLKESAGETWRGKYWQKPIYAKNPLDNSFIIDPTTKEAIITGYETVKTPGIQSYIRDPEKIVKKGAEYAMGEVEDYLDPQRLIQDKIDETIGIKRDQQVTIVQEYNPPSTLEDMPDGFSRLPDLPGMDFLSIANHTNNINNGDFFASPYDYKEEKPYALPGYVGAVS
jgi:hypothetical protein